MKKFICGLAVALAIGATPAAAGVIDFNTLPGANGDPFTSYTQNGFTVTNISNFEVGKSPFLSGVPTILAPGVNNDASGDSSFSLKATDGGDFTLTSLDVYTGSDFTYEIDLVARDAHSPLGISVTILKGSFAGYYWHTYQLGEYSDDLLKEVVFLFHGYDSYQIDNIVVDEPGTLPVPEPATWAMMLMGFGMVGWSMRKRQAYAQEVMSA